MSRIQIHRDTRGVTPVVGVILTVALLVVVAAAIGATAFGFSDKVEEPFDQYEHRIQCEQPEGATDMPTAGLVGHYTFDEVDLGTDVSGNSNHGEAIGSQSTSGVGLCSDAALNPDGDETHIRIDNFPGPDSGLTISAWIKSDDETVEGQRIFADDVDQTGYALSLGDSGNPGTIRFYNRDGDTVSLDTDRVIEADTWYHVVGVYDANANTRAIYIDGVKKASHSGEDDDWAAPGTASIGGETEESTEDNYFVGVIDEVRVYDRPLSEDEITELEDQFYR